MKRQITFTVETPENLTGLGLEALIIDILDRGWHAAADVDNQTYPETAESVGKLSIGNVCVVADTFA